MIEIENKLFIIEISMSRSFKKPYHGIACCKAKDLRKAKKTLSQTTRREVENSLDLSSGSYYKKFQHSWRWRPDDGKTYSPIWKKAYRK